MKLFTLFSIITTVSNFGIAIFLLLKWKKNPSARIFSGVAVSSGLWGLACSVSSSLPETSYNLALLWWQIGYSGVIFVCAFFTHFVIRYLSLQKKWFIRTIYLLSFLFLLLNWYGRSRLFLGKLNFIFEQFYWHDWLNTKSIIYLVFYVGFYMVLLGYNFFLIIKAYNRSTGIRRNQLKYFILGVTIGWIGAEFEFLPSFGIHLYPYSILMIGFYPLFITYAIIKYRLMDIKIAATRVSIFTIVYTVVLGLPFYIGYQTKSWLTMGISMFVLATAGPFLYIYFQRKAERFLLSRTTLLQEELQTTQAKLLQAERLAAAGTMASGLAHEIKNPLTSIRTFADYVDKKYADAEFRKKFKRIVPSELDRIGSIVKQLLEFSSPKPLELKPSNVRNLLEETLELIEIKLKQQNISLAKNFCQDIPEVSVDSKQIKQAFLNIILNAIDAMPDGGEIVVETTLNTAAGYKLQDTNSIIIMIKDTGKGIKEEDMPHIFDAFYSKKEKGVGLGLAITYGIIQNHKGTINVESTPNHGTTFTITLPLST
ncbi:MAG: hypothetical protein JW734_02540 [Candidatus Omnitrophica bacterium]|nr:hypothetical protein [Candidatus Omnitrophota bacterium]